MRPSASITQIWGVPVRLDVKAISCPVGLQQGAVSEAEVCVRRRGDDPSAFATQMSMFPARLLAKAIFVPSGLYEGAKAWLAFSPVTFAVLFPSKIDARKMTGCPCRYDVYRSERPSGLHVGVMLSALLTVRRLGLNPS